MSGPYEPPATDDYADVRGAATANAPAEPTSNARPPNPAEAWPLGDPTGADSEAVLVSNGPGELYTWTLPVLRELRRRAPRARVSICLIPCQFASGREAHIARTFGADRVSTPGEYLRSAALGRAPAGVGERRYGFVLALGGNPALSVALGRRLGWPTYRYAFEPGFPDGLERLFIRDEGAAAAARRQGAPAERTEVVGNLTADAVRDAPPVATPGDPHVLLFGGSRDGFTRALLPLLIGAVDRLAPRYPDARFVWPVSRLLSERAIEAGIAGEEAWVTGGAAGRREGDRVITPGGATIAMVPEDERYRHMRSADLALTIPGTNTLELGIAGVPTVVVLPLDRAEVIPLEGLGHWLGLVPLVGTFLKRTAVRLYVEGLKRPISLPNDLSGERLFVEITGRVDPDRVVAACTALLDAPERRAEIRRRLAATMPAPGAAATLMERVARDAARLAGR